MIENIKNKIKKEEIKINVEYSNLIHSLSDFEYEELKDSIKAKGLQSHIVINQKNEILDGHHRFKICEELGIEPEFEIKKFDNESEEQEFIIYMNLRRRQLNDFQRSELAYKLEVIEKEGARLRQLSKLKDVKDKLPLPSNEVNGVKGETSDIVSKKVGTSRGTYERAKKIIEYGSEDIKEKLRQGKTTINKEYKKIKKDRERQELLSKLDNEVNKELFEETSNCKLIIGDFIEKGKDIEDNSIDLILTDPPYNRDSLYLYEELAKLAVRVLKPGGCLITLVGHIIMNEVFRIFDKYSLINDTGLTYWWIFAVKHVGHHTKVHSRNIFAEYKPMLWYVKKNKENRAINLAISNTIGDYIESKAPTKSLHEWEQSRVEAEYVIRNLTIDNQTILDPMMGTGTTGIASLNLKRRFIGIEIEQERFLIAKNRLYNTIGINCLSNSLS